MTSKLTIYNGALEILGERALSSLSENREPRRRLDGIWDRGGVNTCLQFSQWNFAINSAQFDYDTNITPTFGYRYVFGKPSDFVRTAGVCTDEYFRCPLIHYMDDNGYWRADHQVLYIRYVSNHVNYGLDYAKWPFNFTRMVEAWFATQISSIASDEKVAKAQKEFDTMLMKSKATDSMETATKFPPRGSWTRARASGYKDRTPGGALY